MGCQSQIYGKWGQRWSIISSMSAWGMIDASHWEKQRRVHRIADWTSWCDPYTECPLNQGLLTVATPRDFEHAFGLSEWLPVPVVRIGSPTRLDKSTLHCSRGRRNHSVAYADDGERKQTVQSRANTGLSPTESGFPIHPQSSWLMVMLDIMISNL